MSQLAQAAGGAAAGESVWLPKGMAHVVKFGNKHGNCSVKIKKVDGKIQEERTYGKDPKRSKG